MVSGIKTEIVFLPTQNIKQRWKKLAESNRRRDCWRSTGPWRRRKAECRWGPLVTRVQAPRNSQRPKLWNRMKGSLTDEWWKTETSMSEGGSQQTQTERERQVFTVRRDEARRGETKPSGTQGTAEQNNTIIYRSHRSAHVRLRVLSGFKTKHHTPGTTKLPCDLTDLKPCVFTPMGFFFLTL